MSPQEIQALEEELMRYVADVGDGKHFELLGIEIRHKLDVLNRAIQDALEEGNFDDLHILIHIAYHYYQMLYG